MNTQPNSFDPTVFDKSDDISKNVHQGNPQSVEALADNEPRRGEQRTSHGTLPRHAGRLGRLPLTGSGAGQWFGGLWSLSEHQCNTIGRQTKAAMVLGPVGSLA